jgi:hypothetical protein
MRRYEEERMHPAAGFYRTGGRFLLLAITVLAALALGGGAGATDATPVAAPTIASDQADYAPGSTVTLTGANWLPGELVHVYVNDDRIA